MASVSPFSPTSLYVAKDIPFFSLGDSLIQRILAFVSKTDLASISYVSKKWHRIVKLIRFHEKIGSADFILNSSWVDEELFLDAAKVRLFKFDFPFICIHLNNHSSIKCRRDSNKVVEYQVDISQKCFILDHQKKTQLAFDKQENRITILDRKNIGSAIANDINEAGFEVTFVGQRAFNVADDDGNSVFKLYDLQYGTLLCSDELIEEFYKDSLGCFPYICYYKEHQLSIIDTHTGSKSILEMEEVVPSAQCGSHFVEFYKAETRVMNLDTKNTTTLPPCPENGTYYFSQNILLYELECKKGLHLQLFNCLTKEAKKLRLNLPNDWETRTLFLYKNALYIIQENNKEKKTMLSQYHFFAKKTRQLFILDEIDLGISVIEWEGRLLIKNGERLQVYNLENEKKLFRCKNVYLWEYLREQKILAIVSNPADNNTVNIAFVDIVLAKVLFSLRAFSLEEIS